MPRGALIVLEGLDRSGKSTQVARLEQRLVDAGQTVAVFRFPDRSTAIGSAINQYLTTDDRATDDDHAIHLLFAANRWERARAIRDHLAAGTTVLCDRYYYSGIVYSAAKHLADLPLSWARAPEIGLPRPDAVCFLDLDPQQAQARHGYGTERYEKQAFQERVRELFWALALGAFDVHGRVHTDHVRTLTQAGPTSSSESLDKQARIEQWRQEREARECATLFQQEEEDLIVVDAAATVDEVAADIWAKIQPRLRAVQQGELGTSVRVVA